MRHPRFPAAHPLTDRCATCGVWHAAADPCLEEQYAIDNYGTCCAHGGYKKEGHKDVCRQAKAHLVKRTPTGHACFRYALCHGVLWL